VTGEDDIEHLVLVRLAQLNAVVVGLVSGLLLGSAILVLTIILVVRGGEVVGPHLGLLGQVFIGYRVTVAGGFIGFLYGLAVGFVAGFLFTLLYNRLAVWREGRRTDA
jgi:hypothetical protein